MLVRVGAIMIWLLMLIMLLISNTKLAKLEAENKFLIGSYWQLHNSVQSRIAVVQQRYQSLTDRHNYLLGLTGVKDVESPRIDAE